MKSTLLQNAIPVMFQDSHIPEILDKCDKDPSIYLVFSTNDRNQINFNLGEETAYRIKTFDSSEKAKKKYGMEFKVPLKDIKPDIQSAIVYLKTDANTHIVIGSFIFQPPQIYIANQDNIYGTLYLLVIEAAAPLVENFDTKELPLEKAQIAWQITHTEKTQINPKDKNYVNSPSKNISMVFNNRSSLYLLYKANNKNNFYLGIFELHSKKMIGIFQLIKNPAELADFTFHEKAVGTDATGTNDPKTYVTWYLTHNNGLLRLHVDNLSQKIAPTFRETYKDLQLTEDVTLSKLKKYHLLIAGNEKYDGYAGYARASDGRENTAPGKYWFLYGYRTNCISEYIGEHIYSCGGLIKESNPYPTYFMEYKPCVPNEDFPDISSSAKIGTYSIGLTSKLSDQDKDKFNTKNFRSTVVDNKIFMFHIDSFKKENFFYIFNSLQQSFDKHTVPNFIVEQVTKGALSDYQNIQITTAGSKIFFALTSSDTQEIQTQIISFDTAILQD